MNRSVSNMAISFGANRGLIGQACIGLPHVSIAPIASGAPARPAR
jgi:hypothetical protein